MIAGCSLPMDPMHRGGTYTTPKPQEELVVAASPSEGGTVARSPDQAEYEGGTVVILTANPAAGYSFTRWERDSTGSANPTSIIMEENKTVTAVFTPNYALTVLVSPLDGGTVTECGNGQWRTLEHTQYPSGSMVAVTAYSALGYEFAQWEGDVTGAANPTTFTMDGDKAATAVFTPATTPLIRLSTSRYIFWVSGKDGNYHAIDNPFSSQNSSQDPGVINGSVTNGGIGTLSGLECTSTARWLSATLIDSTAPATLTLTLIPLYLPLPCPSHDIPSCRIIVSSASAKNSPQYVDILVCLYPDSFRPLDPLSW